MRLAPKSFLPVLLIAATPGHGQEPPLDTLYDLLCGQTIHVFYGSAGNQIEYLDPDGTSYFWNSGRSDVIQGQWRIAEGEAGPSAICFQYAPGSLRPTHDGEEFCLEGAWFITTFVEDGLRPGDPYNLQSGTPPFVMQPVPAMDVDRLRALYPDRGDGGRCTPLLSS